MWLTFNCGIGMAVITPADEASAVIQRLQSHGEQAFQIGEIVTTDSNNPAYVERLA